MENCRPSKSKVNLSFASGDIGFLGVKNVTLSCSQYLNKVHHMLLLGVVYVLLSNLIFEAYV